MRGTKFSETEDAIIKKNCIDNPVAKNMKDCYAACIEEIKNTLGKDRHPGSVQAAHLRIKRKLIKEDPNYKQEPIKLKEEKDSMIILYDIFVKRLSKKELKLAKAFIEYLLEEE